MKLANSVLRSGSPACSVAENHRKCGFAVILLEANLRVNKFPLVSDKEYEY